MEIPSYGTYTNDGRWFAPGMVVRERLFRLDDELTYGGFNNQGIWETGPEKQKIADIEWAEMRDSEILEKICRESVRLHSEVTKQGEHGISRLIHEVTSQTKKKLLATNPAKIEQILRLLLS